MNFCENCGAELTSLFCESCGMISTSNVPNSLSNDDSLAGLLSALINNGRPLLFSELLSFTNSRDRTFRIFSQLEKTNNFLLIKQTDDYKITIKKSKTEKVDTIDSIQYPAKISILKYVLEIVPLSLSDINSIFPIQVNLAEFQKILGKDYLLIQINGIFQIKKKI